MTKSKATTQNPKDLIGNTKVSISKLPAIAVAHGAMAMMDGATKYGAYNWRDKEVVAGIYIDAAKRHLDCWFEGQEVATDSKAHHLGHAIACCAILLDAQAKGKLVDDRPKDSADLDFMERELAKLSEIIKARKAEIVAKEPKLVRYETHTDLPKVPDTGDICEECKRHWGGHFGTKCDSHFTSTRRWTVKV